MCQMLAPLGCSRSPGLLEDAEDSVPFMALASSPPLPSWVMAPRADVTSMAMEHVIDISYPLCQADSLSMLPVLVLFGLYVLSVG
jgi:hypothetical protein